MPYIVPGSYSTYKPAGALTQNTAQAQVLFPDKQKETPSSRIITVDASAAVDTQAPTLQFLMVGT